MMMTKVDLKSEGLVAGSRTVEDDWNDWNKPVISRDSAKLLRNNTLVLVSILVLCLTRN